MYRIVFFQSEVSAGRSWPPPFREEPFSALAKELNLPVQGFNDAATRVRTFIAEIDAAV